MKLHNALISIGILATILSPAFGCYRATFVNQSPIAVEVLWGAQGCAGVKSGYTEICTSKSVGSGSSASYDYLWGTTIPTVWVLPSNPVGYNCSYSHSGYMYSGSGFVDGTEWKTPACSTSYTINYTSTNLWWDTGGCYGAAPS